MSAVANKAHNAVNFEVTVVKLAVTRFKLTSFTSTNYKCLCKSVVKLFTKLLDLTA